MILMQVQAEDSAAKAKHNGSDNSSSISSSSISSSSVSSTIVAPVLVVVGGTVAPILLRISRRFPIEEGSVEMDVVVDASEIVIVILERVHVIVTVTMIVIIIREDLRGVLPVIELVKDN